MDKNNKILIVENLFGQKLGEITFLPEKKEFTMSIFSDLEKEKIERLLEKYLKYGIRNLGPVILEKPIRSDNPLFFQETLNQLAKNGYVVYPKL